MGIVTEKDKIDLITSAFGEGSLSKDSKNISVVCPDCGKTKSIRKRKLSICLETGLYHCWVCELKGKNIAYLAKKVSAFKNVIDGLAAAFGSLSFEEVVEEEAIKLPDDFTLLSLSNSRSAKIAKSYLYSRGLTDTDIMMYKTGISNDFEFTNRIIFPSFDSDLNLNFFLSRTYDKKQKIAYRNCVASKKDIIFNENIIDWSKELVLVEGVFDAVKVKRNVACMLGSWIDENYLLFKKIILNRTPVVLALDPDARGKAMKIAKKLSEYCIDVRLTDHNSKDFGDMNPEEVENFINNAKHFDVTNRIGYLIGEIKSGSIY